MAGGEIDILILAGRLSRYDARWPLVPWLERLERRGCRLQVLCLARGSVLEGDSRCFELAALGNRWMRTWAARSLWAEEALRRPELVHVVHDEMSEVGLILAETAGLPYIQTVADFRTLERGLRLSRRWCRHLVAIRPELANGLVEGLGIPASRVSVVAPGIAPATEPRRDGAPGHVPVIGAGGPLDEMSGLTVFLEAARQVLDDGRDSEFVIATHGTIQAELRRRAQSLRIGEYLTITEFPSIGADYWAVLDMYCQPSIAANSGVTLLQAMAHEVPCIATGVAGLRGLIEPGISGLIIPPGNPEALRRGILMLLDDPELARRLGRNARTKIQSSFDPETEADRLVSLYRRLVCEAC